jgi:hypothetical protein
MRSLLPLDTSPQLRISPLRRQTLTWKRVEVVEDA